MTVMAELQQNYARAVQDYAASPTQDNWLRVVSLEWRMEREKRNAVA